MAQIGTDPPVPDEVLVGEFLAAIEGLSQPAAAKWSGIRQQTISRFRRGDWKRIHRDTRAAIERFLAQGVIEHYSALVVQSYLVANLRYVMPEVERRAHAAQEEIELPDPRGIEIESRQPELDLLAGVLEPIAIAARKAAMEIGEHAAEVQYKAHVTLPAVAYAEELARRLADVRDRIRLHPENE